MSQQVHGDHNGGTPRSQWPSTSFSVQDPDMTASGMDYQHSYHPGDARSSASSGNFFMPSSNGQTTFVAFSSHTGTAGFKLSHTGLHGTGDASPALEPGQGVSSQHIGQDHQTHPSQLPLSHWLNAQGPWVPSGLTHEAGMQNVPHGLRDYRHSGSIVPSDCETVAGPIPPSDSGYQSNAAKPGFENTSVYGDPKDHGHDTSSLIEPFAFVGLGEGISEVYAELPEDLHVPASVGVSRDYTPQQIGRGDPLFCEECKKHVKTKSELRKHELRHSKPHRCTEPGCIRDKGFSSINDLDRHKRSKHPSAAVSGNRYRCHLPNCRTKGGSKIWPRADNFRQHLKRVHKYDTSSDDDLAQFVYRQDITSDLAGCGSRPFPMSDPHELSMWPPTSQTLDISPSLSPLETTEARLPETIGTGVRKLSAGLSAREPSSVSQGSCAGPAGLSQEMELDSNHKSYGSAVLFSNSSEYAKIDSPGSSDYSQEKMGRKGWKDSDGLTSSLVSHDSVQATSAKSQGQASTEHDFSSSLSDLDSSNTSDESKPYCSDRLSQPSRQGDVSNCSVTHEDQSELKQLLTLIEQKKELLEKNFGLTILTQASSDHKLPQAETKQTSEPHACQKCDKLFKIPSQLKKHMKRHDKPYGCTFPNCAKKFGSKNDWKRHESSQHFQLEVWKCDLKNTGNPEEGCEKACQRREAFRQHLRTDHGIQDPKVVDDKSESCRIGRNGESRFWCGFCGQAIENKKKGLAAWTERFNHIDEHFMGHNNREARTIADWKHVDPEQRPTDFSGVHTNEPSPAESDSSASAEGCLAATTDTAAPVNDLPAHKNKKRKPSDSESGTRNLKKSKTNDLRDECQVTVIYCCGCGFQVPIGGHCTECEHRQCYGCHRETF